MTVIMSWRGLLLAGDNDKKFIILWGIASVLICIATVVIGAIGNRAARVNSQTQKTDLTRQFSGQNATLSEKLSDALTKLQIKSNQLAEMTMMSGFPTQYTPPAYGGPILNGSGTSRIIALMPGIPSPTGSFMFISTSVLLERSENHSESSAQVILTLRNTNKWPIQYFGFLVAKLGDVTGRDQPLIISGTVQNESIIEIFYSIQNGVELPGTNTISGTLAYEIHYKSSWWPQFNETLRIVDLRLSSPFETTICKTEKIAENGIVIFPLTEPSSTPVS